MSDEPLFKNADAQEAAYAPEGSEGDRSDLDTETAGTNIVIPAAGLSNIGTGAGTGGPVGTPAVGPALAGAALAGDLDPDRDRADRDRAEGVNDADAQTPSG